MLNLIFQNVVFVDLCFQVEDKYVMCAWFLIFFLFVVKWWHWIHNILRENLPWLNRILFICNIHSEWYINWHCIDFEIKISSDWIAYITVVHFLVSFIAFKNRLWKRKFLQRHDISSEANIKFTTTFHLFYSAQSFSLSLLHTHTCFTRESGKHLISLSFDLIFFLLYLVVIHSLVNTSFVARKIHVCFFFMFVSFFVFFTAEISKANGRKK